MQNYQCTMCHYIYDPAGDDVNQGVVAGTPFEQLPEGWVCPECEAGKDMFEPLNERVQEQS